MSRNFRYINGEIAKVGDIIVHKDNIQTTLNYITISEVGDKVIGYSTDSRIPIVMDNLKDIYLVKREGDIILEGVISNLELLRYKIDNSDETINTVIALLNNLK